MSGPEIVVMIFMLVSIVCAFLFLCWFFHATCNKVANFISRKAREWRC